MLFLLASLSPKAVLEEWRNVTGFSTEINWITLGSSRRTWSGGLMPSSSQVSLALPWSVLGKDSQYIQPWACAHYKLLGARRSRPDHKACWRADFCARTRIIFFRHQRRQNQMNTISSAFPVHSPGLHVKCNEPTKETRPLCVACKRVIGWSYSSWLTAIYTSVSEHLYALILCILVSTPANRIHILINCSQEPFGSTSERFFGGGGGGGLIRNVAVSSSDFKKITKA